MQQGRKTDFGVDDMLALKLSKEIVNRDAQGLLGLEKLHAGASVPEVVIEILTTGRRDKSHPVIVLRCRRTEAMDRFEAERAIEVAVQLDLWARLPEDTVFYRDSPPLSV